MSVIKKLTEGVVKRDLEKEGGALMSKWSETGLLEGIGDDRAKASMARLLENQAQELLREANTMSGGDVEGFAAVAFPIVRRVFGSLIANELVSVQPMSLPSGLIFFLDFQFERTRGANLQGDSLFGGGVVGSQITGGVSLSGPNAENSLRALNQGYSLPTGSTSLSTLVCVASGTFGLGSSAIGGATTLDALCKFDPDLTSGSTAVAVYTLPVASLANLDKSSLIAIAFSGSNAVSGTLVRRLTSKSTSTGLDASGDTYTHVRLVVAGNTNINSVVLSGSAAGALGFSWPIQDALTAGGALGAVNVSQAVGSSGVTFEGEAAIPEIDIKVDSVAVTAKTRKLKAKWTPELGQDLNAYHNLDAEVELTSILSEQIGLEIDQEMLGELVKGATAATLYWSRRPGKFLNRTTGLPIAGDMGLNPQGADFTGNVSMWYETLVETINDVSAAIHRKTLRGGANFLVCGPEVANILEFTSGFRANVVHDDAKGTVGAVKAGSLSKKWDVFVDPYFPRNLVLVGRKGNSFLESGFVYAPYVPLQVTPTIFGTEDFVPRKGVMTRYAKKMVRPDLYGLVVVQDLTG